MAAATALVAFVTYALGLAPELTFAHNGADGGDLIAAARTLGIPHPTGYPTYTLLAWAFTQIPVGTIAYRTNLLSAVCSACAVGITCRCIYLLLPAHRFTPLLSAAAALTLAFSPLFWSQAVISEVYALLALFASLLFLLLIHWRNGAGNHLMWLAAFVWAVGLGNHVTLALAAPPSLALIWPERWRLLRKQTLLMAVAFCVLGLGVYAYLPLAARRQPAVNWGNPQTWQGFVWVVTAKQYHHFAFGLSPQMMLGRTALWADLLGRQFGWWGLPIALVGARHAWRTNKHLGYYTTALVLVVSIYAFFYAAGDSFVLLVPTLACWALWWAHGWYSLLNRLGSMHPLWELVAVTLIAILPTASLGMNWHQAQLGEDLAANTYSQELLEGTEQQGLVIVRGDRPSFGLWYAVYAKNQREDVAVINGPLLAYHWYRENVRSLYPDLILNEPRTEDLTTDDLVRSMVICNAGQRPVYAADPCEDWIEWALLSLEPATPMYRVLPKASWQANR